MNDHRAGNFSHSTGTDSNADSTAGNELHAVLALCTDSSQRARKIPCACLAGQARSGLSFNPSPLLLFLPDCSQDPERWIVALLQNRSRQHVAPQIPPSSMPKPTVLLIGVLTHANNEWQAFGSKYTLKEFRKGTRSQFLANCQNGEYDGVAALYRSNMSVSETGPFDQELVSALPKSLKYICHNGAGYDNIDVDACTKRGLLVSSTPIAVDDATADVGIFLMLGALRQAWVPLVAIREGKWRGKTPIGHDPKGKVLGILGMGGIGRVRPLVSRRDREMLTRPRP